MRGQPEQNTRPHSRLSASFLGMDAWMNSQLNVALFFKLCRSLMCLFFCHVTNVFFIQPGTARCPVEWCRDLMPVLYHTESMVIRFHPVFIFSQLLLPLN